MTSCNATNATTMANNGVVMRQRVSSQPVTKPKSLESHGIESHHAVRAVREIIRRCFLTFKALPDPQASFRHQGRVWRDAVDDYGEDHAHVVYRPTAHEIDQAETILTPWMRFVQEVEGRDSVSRLQAWSYGISTRAQARRERCSETTLLNRIDRSVAKIISKFFGASCKIQVVEEPWKDTEFALAWQNDNWKLNAGVEKTATIQTVFVYEKGLMRNGRRWNDGRGKVEKYKNVA